jgi:hypothetical protein
MPYGIKSKWKLDGRYVYFNLHLYIYYAESKQGAAGLKKYTHRVFYDHVTRHTSPTCRTL